MSTINFKEIDFKKLINKENKIINFNGSEIRVLNYLPIKDKYDLIMITLQKSLENNIYNAFKMDKYLELNIIYLYTNIIFSIEDRINEDDLYDTLKTSGLIDEVLKAIGEEEIAELKKYLKIISEMNLTYQNSFGIIMQNFMEQLPITLQKAEEIIKRIDPEKAKELLQLFPSAQLIK